MKQSIRKLADLILVPAIGVLAMLLFLPRQSRNVVFSPQLRAEEVSTETEQEQGVQIQKASPRAVASLFGWKEKVVEERVEIVPEKEPPAEAGWLKLVGYIAEEEGGRSYIFKNTNTRTMLTLQLNREYKGWTLLEVTETEFLLEFEGNEYIIGHSE